MRWKQRPARRRNHPSYTMTPPDTGCSRLCYCEAPKESGSPWFQFLAAISSAGMRLGVWNQQRAAPKTAQAAVVAGSDGSAHGALSPQPSAHSRVSAGQRRKSARTTCASYIRAVSARVDDLTAVMIEEYGGVARFAGILWSRALTLLQPPRRDFKSCR
jgi:hypothetical protein